MASRTCTRRRGAAAAAAAAAAVVVAVAAGLSRPASAAITRTTFYEGGGGGAACAELPYAAMASLTESCAVLSCDSVEGTADFATVDCPETFAFDSVPKPPGDVYGIAYLYKSDFACSPDTLVASVYSDSATGACLKVSVSPERYMRTDCTVSEPDAMMCNDPACENCETVPADGTCQGLPESGLFIVGFCSDAGAALRPALALAAALMGLLLAVLLL